MERIINDYEFKFHKDFYYPIISLIKTTTIRLNKKPIKEQDICYIKFINSEYPKLLVRILNIHTMKFKDLTNAQALYEGYNHVDLLKHELRNIYTDINEDTIVYIYHFTILNLKKNKSEDL